MSNKKFYLLAVALLASSAVFWFYMFQTPDNSTAQSIGLQNENVSLTMYRSEGCDCCVKWADYLEEEGWNVTTETVSDLYSVKDEHGVPGQLQSCHTALVDGYVIEGHVPVEDIRRLLVEQPDAIGVSAPGMPPNSPGMDLDVENEYQTVLFDGETMTVYNTHN